MNRYRPASQPGDRNRLVFRSARAIDYYRSFGGLTPCEESLFAAHVSARSSVLDVGVGGGRTTPYLASVAGEYLGVDYSPEMIQLCSERFPALEFRVADAADLSFVGDGSTDAIVFSYNGMDYLHPDERRRDCLREFERILVPGGVLLFSAHNARLLFIVPALHGRGWTTGLKALILESTKNIRRLARILDIRFWRGNGYVVDPALGGLMTHITTPEHVEAELTAFGFLRIKTLSSEYPKSTSRYTTPWYYYVFVKPRQQPT